MSPRTARRLAGLAVLAVAVIAAIVSFAHIESLALANGYTISTARLLPFSVDGLILASSLALAAGGRPWLARLGLALGVAATIAANVVFGVHFGVTGAIVNAWPAISFVVSSEILVGMVRGARGLPSAEGAAETVTAEVPIPPVSTPETVADVPGAIPADALPGVPEGTPVTPAGVPENGPEAVTVTVSDDVARCGSCGIPAARPSACAEAYRSGQAEGT